jgi:hypothetical protein
MADDVYVVTATQLNRRVKDEDGEWGSANIPRGTEFAVGDKFADDDPGVTQRELNRWLGLQPRVVASKDDLEAAQRTAADQASLINDLQAQLADANRKLASAAAQGADLSDLGDDDPTNGIAGGGGALEQPAGNASADDWKAYAKQQDPGNADKIDGMTRDDLRDTYAI